MLLYDSDFLYALYIVKARRQIGSGSARTFIKHEFGQLKQFPLDNCHLLRPELGSENHFYMQADRP
jgi:hypothetical protein